MIPEVIANGTIILAFGLAFAAGVIAFASPCVLPLAPGYLSFVTGLTGSELADGDRGRGRVLAGSLLFVLGFSVVFISYGALFGGIGAALLPYQDVINRVLGIVIIALGIAFMGFIPGMQREWRIHVMPRWGVAGAPLLGIVFGLGWTPCIGPTLAAVQGLAFTQASAARGALLSLAYCLGLGLPFVLLAVAFTRTARAVAFLRAHSEAILRIGGALLIVVGVLLVTGAWTAFTVWLRVTLPGFETAL
jgi:cytochrome c-type biogenesis protein